jgi:hypothetical protein
VRRSTPHGGNGGSSHRREETKLWSGQYPVLCLCFPLLSEGSDIWNWGFRLKHDCCYKLIDIEGLIRQLERGGVIGSR